MGQQYRRSRRRRVSRYQASSQALSSATTSSFTIVIIASITAFTFAGLLSRISKVPTNGGEVHGPLGRGATVEVECVYFRFTAMAAISIRALFTKPAAWMVARTGFGSGITSW